MINAKLVDIVTAIRGCLPTDRGNIGLHEPCFSGNEWEYVKECIDTGWVSSVGKFVNQFEIQLAEYTGIKYAVAVVNGTAALHISLKLAGVEQDDEVLIPSLTFVATANAVTYCGAIPHFVDSEYHTLGIDSRKLADYLTEVAQVTEKGCMNKRTGRRIRAVVPMHTFGHPVDIESLLEVSSRFKLEMIEDAAESLGSYYKGRHTGQWGKLSALSFNGNKLVTTGGGGAILTNDQELAKLAKHITTTAKMTHKWDFYHDMAGYNYRMPNINAALGCAQLEQLPVFIANKRKLAGKYAEAFKNISGASFFQEPAFACSNYWLNAIILDAALTAERDTLLQMLHDNDIVARPAWILMHKLPMFDSCPRMNLDAAEDLEQKIINLPSSVFL